jgi:hypothetical protein
MVGEKPYWDLVGLGGILFSFEEDSGDCNQVLLGATGVE